MNNFQEVLSLHRDKMFDLERRWVNALQQLDDEDVNWRPNDVSNSIANLVVHVAGNLRQRFVSGIGQESDIRDRDEEFNTREWFSKTELINLLTEQFSTVHRTLQCLTPDKLFQVYTIKNQDRTVLDVIFEVVTHISEHLGQVLFIAKMRLDDRYQIQWAPHQRR
ncbi:DUF1572 family protein [Alicyclobacillus fodiniaquatilis]|uniref:DUF1572 family protein n=1 Tax=Alicyclobacillus fodiniaquatilis TaxID=1661150 RepID=A0ABW4JFU1_9BACL